MGEVVVPGEMFRIGLLSDTHGYYDARIADHFATCNEIWHAGDIGDEEIVKRLSEICPVIAVYGNIDGPSIRARYPLNQRHIREGVDIWMTHIGGYPGRYDPAVRTMLSKDPPGLFITGHSHILKVMNDKEHGLLHMNPGAAGRSGMHRVRTLLRFELENSRIGNVDVIELGPRSSIPG